MNPPVTDIVRALVTSASLAPSMHNAQPWRFRYLAGRRTVEMRADTSRAIPFADPGNRALHIGCGAALMNLRVAAVHAGFEPVTMLLPDPGDDELLARTRLAATQTPDPGLDRLYPAIRRRHTSREPFTDERVPDTVRDVLRGAAWQEGAQLRFPGPWHVESVLDLVEDAEQRQRTDRRAHAETVAWTRVGADEMAVDDGVPDYAFGPRRWDGRAPVRDFADGRPVTGRPWATFEKTPQLALLGTHGDGRRDWLTAGQALGRVLLEATGRGLATSLTSHALEWSALRWTMRDPLSAMGHVHMVLRLGYGPAGPPTPRRPVADILDVV